MVRRKQRTQRGGVDENTPEQIIKRCRETIAELKRNLVYEREMRAKAEQALAESQKTVEELQSTPEQAPRGDGHYIVRAQNTPPPLRRRTYND